MSKVRNFVRKIPFVLALHRKIKSRKAAFSLKSKSPEQIFKNIYKKNFWNGKESISGSGSDSDQTTIISSEIPAVLNSYGIRSMLDIPSGDFNWMQNISLSGIEYLGADIVDEIVADNIKKYTASNVSFMSLNLLTDPLPDADLILCRDCLVHFSHSDIWRALNNICSTSARYLLTTTFTDRHRNSDIETGQWRPINLGVEPFSLPTPIQLINEGCSERDGKYSDKSLGLWSIPEIRDRLTKSGMPQALGMKV